MQKIFSMTFLLLLVFSAFASDRTNFVLIIADDISWDDFACYGNKVIKTPNIDKLAGKGVLFTNAFLTASSCSPSRCSIISGKYPHNTGTAELHTELPLSEIPFPLLLKNEGYYTAQSGKWHMGPNVYRAFDRFTDNNGYNVGNGGEDLWISFLAERPKDKPFFFWLASHDAHRDWGADNFHITHQPDAVNLPPYFADTPETRQDLASYYNEIARFDYYVGKVCEELEKQEVLENTMIIVMADNGRPFPRCKTRVYDSGMKSPFVIFWPNGIKKKGMHTSALISAVDIAPTILEIAGVKKPNDYLGKSFLTLVNDADAEIRDAVFSEHNWHDYEAHERMVRTKDFLYVRNARPNLSNCGPADSKTSPTQHSLNAVRDSGKLTSAQTDIFIVPRPFEELFDLKNDPEQLVNIASVPKYKTELEKMRQKLNDWQSKTGDTVPKYLTRDWYDRETGDPLPVERKRGEMPGKLK